MKQDYLTAILVWMRLAGNLCVEQFGEGQTYTQTYKRNGWYKISQSSKRCLLGNIIWNASQKITKQEQQQKQHKELWDPDVDS